MSYREQDECHPCDGSGKQNAPDEPPCEDCNGTGVWAPAERMYRVTFPDGELANVYARALSVGYGPEEYKRRWPDGDHSHYLGIDAEVECAADFRKMSPEQQIELARDLDFRRASIWLLSVNERLTVDELADAMHDRLPIAQGFFDRQSQETWASAKLELYA